MAGTPPIFKQAEHSYRQSRESLGRTGAFGKTPIQVNMTTDICTAEVLFLQRVTILSVGYLGNKALSHNCLSLLPQLQAVQLFPDQDAVTLATGEDMVGKDILLNFCFFNMPFVKANNTKYYISISLLV